MATDKRKDAQEPAGFENQAVAIAEQLGRIAGTIEGTAEQWLNRQSLTDQLTRVRDSASQLLESISGGAAKGRQVAAEGADAVSDQVRSAANRAVSAASSAVSSIGASAAKATQAVVPGRAKSEAQNEKSAKGKTASKPKARPSMDLAHAPGKKHRQPAPTLRGVKKSNESIPKMRTAAAARQRRKSYA